MAARTKQFLSWDATLRAITSTELIVPQPVHSALVPVTRTDQVGQPKFSGAAPTKKMNTGSSEHIMNMSC